MRTFWFIKIQFESLLHIINTTFHLLFPTFFGKWIINDISDQKSSLYKNFWRYFKWNWCRYQFIATPFIPRYSEKKIMKNRCQYQHLQTKNWWLQHVSLCLIYTFVYCVNTASVVCTRRISRAFLLFCQLYIFSSNFPHFSIFSFQYVVWTSRQTPTHTHTPFQMVTHFLYLFT